MQWISCNADVEAPFVEPPGARFARWLTFEDAYLVQQFLSRVDQEDLCKRFGCGVRHDSPVVWRHLAPMNDPRGRSLALLTQVSSVMEVLGLSQIHLDGYGDSAEIAVLVRSDWHNQGLGTRLLAELISRSSEAGVTSLRAYVSRGNIAVNRLMNRFGFQIQERCRDAELHVLKELGGLAPAIALYEAHRRPPGTGINRRR